MTLREEQGILTRTKGDGRIAVREPKLKHESKRFPVESKQQNGDK